jgi:hypothetical protein
MTGKMIRLSALTVAMAAVVSPRASAQTELRWKLQPGDRFAVSVTQTTMSDVAYSGKKLATQIDLAMELGWTVTAAHEKAITIKQSLRRLTFKMESPKVGKVTYDSADKLRPTGQSREVAAAITPLLNAEIELQMTPRGEVQSAKPANEAAEKLLAADAAVDSSFVSKDAIQQLLRQSLIILPEKAVADGDTWTTMIDIASALGKGQQETTYRLAGIVEQEGAKLQKIESTSKLDLMPSPAKDAPTIKEHKQTGSVLFSVEQGRVFSAEQDQKLTTERPYRETTIVVTLSSKQTTKLKPEK